VKIVDVETYPVGAGWKNWLFVRVLTDEGVHGIGEATLNGLTRTCEAAVHELKGLVVGSDPRQIRAVSAALYQRVSNEGGHVHRAVIASIETACWDILGKSLGVGVHQLLGGRVREAVDCYANGWYRTERTPESFAAAAAAATERGFRALKFDPLGTARGFLGPGELSASRAIIAAVRDAVGPAVRLMIDMHARLAPAEAVAFIEACAHLDVFWWEEPATREREEPTSAVAARCPGRIATGENCHSVGQFLTLAKCGGVSIYQPEPMSLGGILPTVAVAQLAAADGAWIAPHQSGGPVATVVCLQLAGFLDNFLTQEHFDPFNEPWTASLVTWTPVIDHQTGQLSLPDGPGLGVDLDVDVARAHPYDPAAFLDVTAGGWERRLGHRPHATTAGGGT
jgi:galactonate dehydratase